ncbi:MAG: tRNA (adenosine(37)-N6)-threonylcarbamoyltransferase complex dimerization subunit type 1 TsaB [Caulobacterales bacterium]
MPHSLKRPPVIVPDQDCILAIDCCFDSCSAAVFDGTRIRASAFERMQRGQAERLTAMVAEVLEAAGDDIRIARLAVTTGPGTFTGVRIGLSFARAFALARSVSCIGLSALEAVALAGGIEGVRAGVFPAPQGVYLALFRNGAPIMAPALLSLEAARKALPRSPILLAGSGAELLAEGVGGEITVGGPDLPDAQDVARLAFHRPAPDAPPSPLYLRAPDIRPPKNLRRTLDSQA